MHGNDDTLSAEDMALGYKQMIRVEHACGDTWRNVSDRLRRIQLAQFLSPHGTVWQVTDLTPEALYFQVDIDRLSDIDGDGFAPGTLLTAHFTDGDAEYSLSGVVQAGDMSILETTFPYSVRSVAAIPEPAVSLLMCAGLLVVAAAHRRVRMQPAWG